MFLYVNMKKSFSLFYSEMKDGKRFAIVGSSTRGHYLWNAFLCGPYLADELRQTWETPQKTSVVKEAACAAC